MTDPFQDSESALYYIDACIDTPELFDPRHTATVLQCARSGPASILTNTSCIQEHPLIRGAVDLLLQLGYAKAHPSIDPPWTISAECDYWRARLDHTDSQPLNVPEPSPLTSSMRRGFWQTANAVCTFGSYHRPWIEMILHMLDAQGKIGNRVADLGCGVNSCGQTVADGKDIASVDYIDDPYPLYGNYFQQDLSVSAEKLAPLIDHLRIYFGGQSPTTVIAIQCLIYMDFRNVLTVFHEFLSPGGRMVLCGQPIPGKLKGNPELKHHVDPRGIYANSELLQFLQHDLGHRIEICQMMELPQFVHSSWDIEELSMLVVSQKQSYSPRHLHLS